MLQQEFTQRVGMQVSAEEYAHIEQVYMASDLDKDEFCKQWVKMNKERVAKAKQTAKAVEADMQQREKLWHIVERYGQLSWEKSCNAAEDTLTKTQQQLCESVGIKMNDYRIEPYFGHTVREPKSVSTVIYEIRKYLKAA